jgi:hypothetical protein
MQMPINSSWKHKKVGNWQNTWETIEFTNTIYSQ